MSLSLSLRVAARLVVMLLIGCSGPIAYGQEATVEPEQTARGANRWGEPIPVGKDAVTARDAAKYVYDYNLRTLVDAYKEVGSKDDAWDEAAIEWLTEMARHFAVAKGYDSPEGFKHREELIALGEPIVESGCDDPLVEYCLGAMLQDAQQNETAEARGKRLVERSYPRLVERGYPADRCFYAARRIWRKYRWQKTKIEEAEKYFDLCQKHALEMILQDDLSGNDGRSLYGRLNDFARSMPAKVRQEFVEQAKRHAKESPYVAQMLVGEYHLYAAWKVRGGGFASEVTEEGWEGFYEHMRLARTSFEMAWEAAPHRPEAATAMVKVAEGISRSPRREMRQWFDRAVKAQCDYLTAYKNLVHGMLPHWHGSYDEIYQFGIECMNTERYDTDIPFMLCDGLWTSTRSYASMPVDDHYLKKPDIYNNVRTVCQRYVEQENASASDEWWKTVWLGFAYKAEQWEDAAQLLDELDDNPDFDALGRFPITADGVISTVKLNTSPHFDAITKAFRAADAGQRDQAVVDLKEILSSCDLHSSTSSRIRSRLQGLSWGSEFDKGEPISLLPDVNLDGWKAVAGKWTRTADNKLQGVSDTSGVILKSETDFGEYWQISGELTHGKSPHYPWFAGVLLLEDDRPKYSIMFHPTQKWVAAGLHSALSEHQRPFEPAGKTTKFVIRVEGDIVNVWLNDELVIDEKEVVGLADSEGNRLAIGAKYWWKDATLIYKNLKIEKLVPEA